MKKQYSAPQIEVFIFKTEDKLVASAATEPSTTLEHDNLYLKFNEVL